MPLANTLVDPQLINIRHLFATPVASLRHPDAHALNVQLKALIASRMAQDLCGAQHSNDGGWQSPSDFNLWGGTACESLVQFAKDFASQLTAVHSEQYGLVEPNFEWKINAWVNVNQAGHANALHGHPGAFWSGVYWVDTGGREEQLQVGGDIEFIDPRGMIASTYNPALRMRIKDCLAAGFGITQVPESGTFLMFPSWLLHSVQRYSGNRPRISIAFNFGV
ncbi:MULTISPECIES: TIGR02466 family protein [unclassified Pseudomonas]|uniref:TIGR02466 family protein n=1 Tax=unclassified Pseudomonas TaxID=196821 RepID=UPI00083989D6|nr:MULTISPECIES: TIGR02466 family protein [unclassified Pseudomonas]QIH08458.1 hypothetical protein ATY02_17905 [Pseudomonas sp. BIOMIG1BAC]